ncbi:protein vip1-like isoform 1 [Hibiscus syriacus]|uniref:Protein vip1-like isoform 1 n=1 Tax=Hibiscus syriacus TaxID=106335 RepID=A0A6A3AGA9_HIBSY|nr:protein vip1-like isoform 1 [Hibiscus syriacus]
MLLSAPGFAVSSAHQWMVFHCRSHWTEAEAITKGKIRGKRRPDTIRRSPGDYDVLLRQAKRATELALKDGKQLMEIEFPTAGLGSVPGDGEGGIETTESMQLIANFATFYSWFVYEPLLVSFQFFPEANEVKFARQVFEGAYFKLDYLTKPSFFEDFGFGEKVKMADRVKPDDELFVVGYPYFNVNEMIVVEELYKEAVMNINRKLIIFNGELDRIRSGCILPSTVYYIHNFKGRNGGTLFRCYPGPWRVLKRAGNEYFFVDQQEAMPSLKEVALDILPSA